jgi:hypothetical protein
VGGYGGEVRGKTQIDCYLKYVEECEGWPLDHQPDPKYKKLCKKEMVFDHATQEWTLNFRFSK